MVKINPIVAKHYSEDILKIACDKFGIIEKEARLIRANSNLIYDCGDKILRISHSDIRVSEEIEAELRWVEYLREKQLPVVKVLQSKTGELVERIGDDSHFSFVCFEKIKGEKVVREEWNTEHFQALGQLTGRLHRASKEFAPAAELHYKHWDEIEEFAGYQYLQGEDAELLPLHDQLVGEIRTYPKSDDNYGLVHYDIHFENYLKTKARDSIVLFDFEMACKSWFMNDIAIVVYYAKRFPLSRDQEDFEVKFLKDFWIGYSAENELDEREKSNIPTFLLYRDILVLGFLRKIWKMDELTAQQEKFIVNVRESIKKRRRQRGI